jgi:DNA-binding NarL/FixJ family response regulator
MKTVGIIEDQTAIREMISQSILDPEEFKIVVESGDGQEGCDLCLKNKPEFVILDIMLPNLNGAEILRRIMQELPNTNVLIFSGYQNIGLVRELLEIGANGFVEKSASLSDLRKGIETVSNGGTYFGPEVAQLLRESMTNPKAGEAYLSNLTKRERQVLELIAKSFSTREIAAKLTISVKTAENHRTNLMRKLDLHDVASLTRYSINNGLVQLGS